MNNLKSCFFSLNEQYNLQPFSNHDFYHLPNYLKLKFSLTNGIPIYWKSNNPKNKCLIPLIKQKIDNTDKYDLSSPYGYPGILTNTVFTKEEIRQILVEFNNDATKKGFVSTFIRLNPLTNPWKDLSNGIIKQIYHGNTVVVQLDSSIDDIRGFYSKNHKRNLKSLNKNEFSATINDWGQLEKFHTIYKQTMLRHHAAKRYFLPLKYFVRLKEIEAANIFFIYVYSAQNDFTCGGLFSLVNGNKT